MEESVGARAFRLTIAQAPRRAQVTSRPCWPIVVPDQLARPLRRLFAAQPATMVLDVGASRSIHPLQAIYHWGYVHNDTSYPSAHDGYASSANSQWTFHPGS
jgi:hypothetical protein